MHREYKAGAAGVETLHSEAGIQGQIIEGRLD
jgi:hypothetical protein